MYFINNNVFVFSANKINTLQTFQTLKPQYHLRKMHQHEKSVFVILRTHLKTL